MCIYIYIYIYIDPPTVALNYAAMFQTVIKLGCRARADLCARGARISVQKLSWAGAPGACVARADLAGRLPACLGDWLAGWPPGRVAAWLAGSPAGWLIVKN